MSERSRFQKPRAWLIVSALLLFICAFALSLATNNGNDFGMGVFALGVVECLLWLVFGSMRS